MDQEAKWPPATPVPKISDNFLSAAFSVPRSKRPLTATSVTPVRVGSTTLTKFCSRNWFVHASNGDGNCGCVANKTVDCALSKNQLNDPNVSLYEVKRCGGGYCKISGTKNCDSITWLNVYDAEPDTCFATVTGDYMTNLCSQDYFVHAAGSDYNCGCAEVA